jgi:hypothetical protein
MKRGDEHHGYKYEQIVGADIFGEEERADTGSNQARGESDKDQLHK